MNQQSVLDDFREISNEFTIFVIEQKYYLGRGHDYLKDLRGKPNWISSDTVINGRLKKILSWIQKKVPKSSKLLKSILSAGTLDPSNAVDITICLIKLFSATEHYAAGPEVIDPIIIDEQNVSKKGLSQFITLHRGNTRPAIIILLKDNNFERAKGLLTNCPSGTNVKMIRNSGETVIYKVINEGAKNTDDFMDAFSRQCFSTCSSTKRDILLSSSWSEYKIINDITPQILQIRSTFITEHKLDASDNINILANSLATFETRGVAENRLKSNFTCMSKLFNVYLRDFAGRDLDDALLLADELDSDILRAHVYRYSHFFDCSRIEKQELLDRARQIFLSNDIADHAIYCQNNKLIHQFSQDRIDRFAFTELEGEAVNNTPGLAMMAHIVNNVGVAHLFNLFLPQAVEAFDRGLGIRHRNSHIQELALKSNRMVALVMDRQPFDEKEARRILDRIFSPVLGFKKMPFLTAQFALNVLASAIKSDPLVARELLNDYEIIRLIQCSFDMNPMGTGSMCKQLEALSLLHSEFSLVSQLNFPKKRTDVSGIRLEFICLYGLNPFFFNVWV